MWDFFYALHHSGWQWTRRSTGPLLRLWSAKYFISCQPGRALGGRNSPVWGLDFAAQNQQFGRMRPLITAMPIGIRERTAGRQRGDCCLRRAGRCVCKVRLVLIVAAQQLAQKRIQVCHQQLRLLHAFEYYW